MWDSAAIILALSAIVLRWRDEPKWSAVAGYTSTACSAVAGMLGRRRSGASTAVGRPEGVQP